MLKESDVEGVAPGSPQGDWRRTRRGDRSKALVGGSEERSRVAIAAQ